MYSFNSADEVDPAPIKKNAIPDAKKSWKSMVPCMYICSLTRMEHISVFGGITIQLLLYQTQIKGRGGVSRLTSKPVTH